MRSDSQNKSNSVENKIIFGLYGAGGFAREVMPFVRDSLLNLNQENKQLIDQLFFIETNPSNNQVNGRPIISENDFFKIDSADRFFNVGIGDSKLRERISNSCMSKGAKLISLISPHSIIYDNNEIGDGAIICANTMITSNTKIGKCFHANIFSYVAHDCIIGDYVTFAPNVHCNGNVHIHNHAYIGTGAVIKQGSSSKPLIIGESAVIGMGAVVTKDVPAFTTVVGNPAKPFIKN